MEEENVEIPGKCKKVNLKIQKNHLKLKNKEKSRKEKTNLKKNIGKKLSSSESRKIQK